MFTEQNLLVTTPNVKTDVEISSLFPHRRRAQKTTVFKTAFYVRHLNSFEHTSLQSKLNCAYNMNQWIYEIRWEIVRCGKVIVVLQFLFVMR